MINPRSVNVTDLAIFRIQQTGRGGDGTSVKIASDLRAHQEESEVGQRSIEGRDTVISNTLMIDGVDSGGKVIDVAAHDLAQWTDWKGTKTDQLEIVRVSPHSQPGRGVGISGIAHVRLDVGS